MENNKFDAVIFDMDGLLLDSEKVALDIFQEVCTHFKLPDLTNAYYKCIGTNAKLTETILRSALAGLMEYEKFISEFDKRHTQFIDEQSFPLKKGVTILLNHFTDLNIPMAIATSTATEMAKHHLVKTGILSYFTAVIGGDQVKNSKPDPEIYIKAAESLKVNPENCLVLEDSENGVKAGLAAKMTVVQVPDLIKPDEEFMKMGQIVLDSLADVIKYKF
jgi:beta-phosphoglucomutase-like phosphatase (HAD superfamily)